MNKVGVNKDVTEKGLCAMSSVTNKENFIIKTLTTLSDNTNKVVFC